MRTSPDEKGFRTKNVSGRKIFPLKNVLLVVSKSERKIFYFNKVDRKPSYLTMFIKTTEDKMKSENYCFI